MHGTNSVRAKMHVNPEPIAVPQAVIAVEAAPEVMASLLLKPNRIPALWCGLKFKGGNSAKEIVSMLWTILVILLILWLLGFVGSAGGNLIHLLLVVALIVLIINLVSGRRGPVV